MKEIIINGQSLDISDQEPVALTLQVNNIAELKDRQANYSNEIKIPLTAGNRIKLGNPDLANSISVKPYRRRHTVYKENGIIVIPAGVSQINQSEGDFANLVIFSGIMDFFTIIKDKKLSDLDFSSYDHLWNAETAASLNIDGGNEDQCIYPIIQTGTTSDIDNPYNLHELDGKIYKDSGHTERANLFGIQYQTPAVYFKKIIDKIFEGAGYQKSGAIFSDELYNKIIILCNGDLTYPKEFVESRSSTVGTYEVLKHKKNSLGGAGTYWGPFVFPFNNEQQVTTYNNSIVVGATYLTGYFDGDSNCFDPATHTYTANGSFRIKIDVRVPVDIPMGDSTATPKISLKKNGVEIGESHIAVTAGPSAERYNVLSINDIQNICQPGDKYWVTFEIHNENFLTLYEATVPSPKGGAFAFTNENIYFKITILPEIGINQILPISKLLPDMTQSDFIKAWAQMFGIIFQADSITNTMQCNQFKEIPQSIPVDFSNKLDLSQKINIKYRFENYGQVNHLKYAKGEESEKEGIGDDVFLIDDECLNKSVNVIELPWQASGSTTILGNILCANIPMYEAGNGLPIVYTKKDLKPRILAVKKMDKRMVYSDDVNDDILIYEGTIHPVGYFDEIGQDRSLAFSNDLKVKNYTELIEALNNCKIVRAYFYMTAADIQNLDFFRQVYVEFFNLMFYINIVEQYIEGRSTLIELVKL